MNMDASFNEEKSLVQAGIVIKNEFGDLVGGHTFRFLAISHITVEALALGEAMNMAANCNMRRVFVESDC